MPPIRTTHLRRVFGGTVAVDALDLEVAEGEIFGLVGPDGAGKTTTLRMLAGILEPSGGAAEVAGCDVRRAGDRLKDRVGYMSQRFGLYPDLSVLENLTFYADIFGVPARGRAEKIERLLEFSRLAPFIRRLAGHLSGGMKQKLGLACALIHGPRVLLLDEPTNGVDPVSRRDFWRILNQLVREGMTILVSTAYLDEAERCGRLALMDRGRILAQGTPDEIKGLLVGGTWEIRLPDRARLAAIFVREQMPRAAVALHGDRLHVTADGLDEAALRSLARAGGLAIAEIRPIEPSLEDVFVAVLARRDPGASQQGGAAHAG